MDSFTFSRKKERKPIETQITIPSSSGNGKQGDKTKERPKPDDSKLNMSKDLIKEDFPSILSLVYTLSSRPNNVVMEYRDNSKSGEFYFTKTQSYSEAVELLLKGYTEILPEVSQKYKQNIKILSQNYVKRKSNIEVISGGCPNVPRSIMCLPKDFINREVTTRKVKTITVVYNLCVSWVYTTQEFIDAGIALLSAIKCLEMSGIRLKLISLFYSGKSSVYPSSHKVIGSVLLKDYGDSINLLKLCFPLAHPSMFRRIGFKFLETVPGLEDIRFRVGYEVPIDVEKLKELYPINSDVVVLGLPEIMQMKYNVKTLIKYIQENVKR